MAKRDIDLYHSRITQDDLNKMIIKYRIPRGLHPRPPSEEFLMSEHLDEVIAGSSGFDPGYYFRSALSVFADRADSDIVSSLPYSLAILDYMTWRHPDSVINDLNLVAGSYTMADVCRLSAHVVKLKDMTEGLWVCMTFFAFLSRLVLKFRRRLIMMLGRPFRGILFILLILLLMLLSRILLWRNLLSAILVLRLLLRLKLPRSKKASTSGSASGHAAKRTRSAVAQSFGSTTHPNLFVDNSGAESDDDDDACYEIPGKGIISDANAAVAPSVGVSRLQVSFGHAPSFRELSRDVIGRDCFPFSLGPYYASYPEGGVAGNYKFTREEWEAPHQPTLTVLTKEDFKDPSVCKTVVDQFPTPREMVWIEALSSDQLNAKMSVLHCLMMSYSSELLDRYRGLLQSYHEAKGKERKKKIKSLTKSLDILHAEVVVFTVLEAERDKEILRLKATLLEVQAELFSLFASASFERGLTMHQTKEKFAAVLEKTS
nr:hypothetical protein [Tanacetum cinerariifolium]